MSWWNPDKFAQKRAYLEQRTAIIQAVRSFFDSHGFCEVQTSLLQVSPCAEAHLHGFKATLLGTDLKPKQDLYLHTSPEFAMKKLLVAGMEKIYQVCPVFRNGEGSVLHSPEFTMLEWYRINADYRDIMRDCINLVQYLSEKLNINVFKHGKHTADPNLNWNVTKVVEVFDKYVEIDLNKYLGDRDGFATVIQEKGIRIAEDDTWDDLFFRVMAEKVEPNLGIGAPTILYDYPAHMAALSRKKPTDPRFAERFELYICGVELANAFSELTDAAEQRARYEAEMKLKQDLYGETYPVDEDFIKALEHGLPESGGIALGIDRLVMLATGAEKINQVLWCQNFFS